MVFKVSMKTINLKIDKAHSRFAGVMPARIHAPDLAEGGLFVFLRGYYVENSAAQSGR
jgi:hypothetical protein